ncbi:hypothetical protein Tco_1003218 [Tanacetum coccineum]|uniref:Uncharacterized protein n=1 Tax=Tanacetum coccineum TaxID=301880 RepID=A0ABQ5F9U2_9ASTR
MKKAKNSTISPRTPTWRNLLGVVLPDCLTSPAMKESKAYKTYLANTGEVPPKAARKFKKASPSKKDSVPVQADEEPVQKGKKV